MTRPGYDNNNEGRLCSAFSSRKPFPAAEEVPKQPGVEAEVPKQPGAEVLLCRKQEALQELAAAAAAASE